VLVLFDIDDTLVDHGAAERAAIQALYGRVHSTHGLEQFTDGWRAAAERHFSRYVAGELSMDEQRRARVREVIDARLTDIEADRIFRAFLDAYESACAPFDDARACLDALVGHRLGVISNGQSHQQLRKLRRAGLLEAFEVVVVSDECGFAKPEPEIFAHACALAGEPRSNAIYVGDRYDVDATAARRAGLVGVWLDRAGLVEHDRQPPTLRSLRELKPLVESLRAAARRGVAVDGAAPRGRMPKR
jgi:putative hydrolase of the HAD superfamily